METLRRCAKERLLHAKNLSILSNEELDQIWVALERHSLSSPMPQDRLDPSHIQMQPQPPPLRLDYQGFRQVRDDLCQRDPEKFSWLFQSLDYLRLPHDPDHGSIDTRLFFNYLLRRASLFQERVCIALYDRDSDGYLTELDLENYVTDLIPNFPQLQLMEKEFVSFYLCGVSRKFFFYLDGQVHADGCKCLRLISDLLFLFSEKERFPLHSCYSRPSCRNYLNSNMSK